MVNNFIPIIESDCFIGHKIYNYCKKKLAKNIIKLAYEIINCNPISYLCVLIYNEVQPKIKCMSIGVHS